jgi:Domain of unknown function (DUF4124)
MLARAVNMRHLAQAMFVLVIMCSMITTAVAQAVYKWTDATGVTHYSEQPPPQAVKAKQLQLKGAAPAPAVSAPSATPPPSAATALDAAKSDFRKQACTTANNNLKLLSGRRMVLDTDTVESPAGVEGAKMLSPEQREAAKSEAQQQIQQYCDRG